MTISAKIKKFLVSFLLLNAVFFYAHAEILQDDDFGYFMDIPEGFQIAQADEDGFSYVLTHPNIDVTLVLKIYYGKQYKNAMQTMNTAMKKLSVKTTGDNCADIFWNDRNCAVANFSVKIGSPCYAWAVCAPCDIENAYLFAMCYTPQSSADITEQFMVSTLNSLYMNENYKNTVGIITKMAFENEKLLFSYIAFEGKDFSCSLGDADLDANIFITELEYSVLYLYREYNLWKEAWQRFYRQIYKDSYERLSDFSENFYKTFYPIAKEKNPQNPDIAYAQIVLDWVQTFDYKRATDARETDFTSMVEILYGIGSDCDSRSMMTAILLNYAGIETILLVSPSYSHAMAAVQNNAPGQSYTLKENGKKYLYGETTADVTWGMIAQDFSDASQWIPVTFD